MEFKVTKNINSLDNIKNDVAVELGYRSNTVFSAYEQVLINPHGLTYNVINNSVDKIVMRYAQEQNKVLLDMLIELRDDCDGNNFSFFRDKIEKLIKEATEL